VRVLGEGGFGTVYLAEQESPRRRVAVKMLRPGVAGPQALARFAHESETLARLSHPGIAQVIEAGFYDAITGDVALARARSAASRGLLPFFAMEFVEGQALTEHAAKLGVRERLLLMIRVCKAVQHAHTKGVIHRDLKPANILVGADGLPKVLDFGVARVTGEGFQERTTRTDVGQIIGTLGYMSPEQVKADPSEIDTRADVYALGAVLYECLAGRAPHRIEGKPLHEAARIICEDAPAKVSTLVPAARGDLETIVHRALEKDKARRYQSAADLGEDLTRFLRNEPILARPPSAVYQVTKFAQRNKLLVGSAAAIVLLLAGASVGMSVLFLRAREAEKQEVLRRTEAEAATTEAKTQRDAARAAERKATAVSEFLARTLASGDPDENGLDVTLASLLDKAAAGIDKEFAEAPDVALAVRLAIVESYRGLGLYDQALPIAERARADAEKRLGAEHPETLHAAEWHAMILGQLSRFEETIAIVSRSYEVRLRTQGPDHSSTLNALNTLASQHQQQGRFAQAEPMFRTLLETRRRLLGEGDERTQDTVRRLGETLANMDLPEKLAEADTLLTGLVATLRQTPEVGSDLNIAIGSLAELRRLQGRNAEAVELGKERLAYSQRANGPEHPRTVMVMNNLAKSMEQAGQFEDAEKLHLETLALREKVSGPESFDALTTVAHLSTLYQRLGRLEDAERMRARVTRGFEKHFGRDHPQAIISATNWAYVLTDLKRFDQAREVLIDVLERRARLLGPDHAEVALTRSMLGFNAVNAGLWPEAEGHLREALRIREKILPEGSGARGVTMTMLGETLARQGRAAEGLEMACTGAQWVLGDQRAPVRNKREACGRAIAVADLAGATDRAAPFREALKALPER
jgi:tetratricopeptide (TPR) repeat protein